MESLSKLRYTDGFVSPGSSDDRRRALESAGCSLRRRQLRESCPDCLQTEHTLGGRTVAASADAVARTTQLAELWPVLWQTLHHFERVFAGLSSGRMEEEA
jgi:hypothetical protein